LTTPIEPRDLEFATDDDVPPHWHPAGPSVTRFFDALSVFFPVGERFFVASVRAHMFEVTDPALREAVRAFAAQEGAHGREHRRYNRRLARQGLPVEHLERQVDRLLRRVSRRAPRRVQLAVTCALEHFTALLATELLSDRAGLEGAHPEMAAMWKWHAVEEIEHKAVAYDVFVAADGTWLERAVVMVAASVIFWAKVLQHQVAMMRADGDLFSAREWLRLGRFLFVDPGPLTAILPRYLAYYAPRFHPDDLPTRDLVDAWVAARQAA
jgi:hypothetical protein